MAKRPVFFPELARYFVQLRNERGWKQAQASDIAQRRGIDLTYQALRGLEEGKTKNPEPELLAAVADLYGKTYQEIVAEFIGHRYRVNAKFGTGKISIALSLVAGTDEQADDRLERGHEDPQASTDVQREPLPIEPGTDIVPRPTGTIGHDSSVPGATEDIRGAAREVRDATIRLEKARRALEAVVRKAVDRQRPRKQNAVPRVAGPRKSGGPRNDR